MSNNCFSEIEQLKCEVQDLLLEITRKTNKLEDIYKEYIKQVPKDNLIALDTLFFQISFIKKDSFSCNELFELVIYQMYGQYFKFYTKIINYVESLRNVNKNEMFKGLDFKKKFSAYNDLRYVEYPFYEIKTIHDLIVSIIDCISVYTLKTRREIEHDCVNTSNGVDIDTLVFERSRFNNNLMNENRMFAHTVNKFYDYQRKTLNRIILKLRFLYLQIETEIRFESLDKYPKEQQIMNDLEQEKIIPQDNNNFLAKLFTNIRFFIFNFFENMYRI